LARIIQQFLGQGVRRNYRGYQSASYQPLNYYNQGASNPSWYFNNQQPQNAYRRPQNNYW
jgi:hypothetical protein